MTLRSATLPLLALLVAVMTGCASPEVSELSTRGSRYAVLPNGGDPMRPGQFVSGATTTFPSAEADPIPYYEELRGHPLQILLLSGGGQNGAFSAGLLNGWTEAGTRPQFDIVTGVSTGALLSTHAFLGTPADDAALAEIFTGIDKSDIYTENGILAIAAGATSLYDSSPLRALLERYITKEVIDRVGAAYDEGRRIYVGTTNLEYNQTWVWNLGAIASEARPGYEKLYIDIILASASAPVAFPPVEIDGHLFADGGTRANLVVVGMAGAKAPPPPRYGPGDMYVVNNGRLEEKPAGIVKSLEGVASHGVNSALSAAMESVLIRAYFAANARGYRYHYLEIPADVDIGTNVLAFDPVQMRAAFDAGRALALKGEDAWADEPVLLDDYPAWLLDALRERAVN